MSTRYEQEQIRLYGSNTRWAEEAKIERNQRYGLNIETPRFEQKQQEQLAKQHESHESEDVRRENAARWEQASVHPIVQDGRPQRTIGAVIRQPMQQQWQQQQMHHQQIQHQQKQHMQQYQKQQQLHQQHMQQQQFHQQQMHQQQMHQQQLQHQQLLRQRPSLAQFSQYTTHNNQQPFQMPTFENQKRIQYKARPYARDPSRPNEISRPFPPDPNSRANFRKVEHARMYYPESYNETQMQHTNPSRAIKPYNNVEMPMQDYHKGFGMNSKPMGNQDQVFMSPMYTTARPFVSAPDLRPVRSDPSFCEKTSQQGITMDSRTILKQSHGNSIPYRLAKKSEQKEKMTPKNGLYKSYFDAASIREPLQNFQEKTENTSLNLQELQQEKVQDIDQFKNVSDQQAKLELDVEIIPKVEELRLDFKQDPSEQVWQFPQMDTSKGTLQRKRTQKKLKNGFDDIFEDLYNDVIDVHYDEQNLTESHSVQAEPKQSPIYGDPKNSRKLLGPTKSSIEYFGDNLTELNLRKSVPVPQSPQQTPSQFSLPSSPRQLPTPPRSSLIRDSLSLIDVPVEKPITLRDLALHQKEAEKGDSAAKLSYIKSLAEAAQNLADNNGQATLKQAKKNKQAWCEEACKILKKLTTGKEAYPPAMFYLSQCSGNGLLGIQIDHCKAFSYYREAAKKGHGPSAFRTAVCYEFGAGVRQDPAKALKYYHLAATLGDVDGMYKLGMISKNGLLGQQEDFERGFKWIKVAARQATVESPHALHELGLLYESKERSRGRLEVDIEKAFFCFKSAAKLHYAPSQYRLGYSYENASLNCSFNPINSIAWYSRGAEKGHADCELGLGGWYLTGAEGILEQDDREAFLWTQKAAEQGLAKAHFALGYFYEHGIGIELNLEEAKYWYVKASEQNNKRAIVRLQQLMMSQ